MDNQTPYKKFSNITYGDSAFKELAGHLGSSANRETYHLSLFLGYYSPDKQEAVKQISQAANLEVEQIDLNDIVSLSETETFAHIDQLFEEYQNSNAILYFTNGDKLCSAYTGFTNSRVKYATPQERYFIKKVQDYKGIIIIDISDHTAADATIRRAAQSIVHFPLPESPFRRFVWNLRNWSPHGYDIKPERPEEVYNKAESTTE